MSHHNDVLYKMLKELNFQNQKHKTHHKEAPKVHEGSGNDVTMNDVNKTIDQVQDLAGQAGDLGQDVTKMIKQKSRAKGKGKAVSPKRKAVSPKRKAVSPKRKAVSPKRKAVSPKRKAVSPKRKAVSPKRKAVSPKRKAVSPKRKAVSPKRKAVSPKRKAVSPKRKSKNNCSADHDTMMKSKDSFPKTFKELQKSLGI